MAIDSGLGWAFVGAGLFTQAVAVRLLKRPMALIRAGGRKEGRVVDSEAELVAGRGAPRTFHFAVVEFTTSVGEKITFRSATGEGSARAKGSVVPVIYDPAKPHDAEVASFKALWLFPVATSVLGLPFLLAGIAALM